MYVYNMKEWQGEKIESEIFYIRSVPVEKNQNVTF